MLDPNIVVRSLLIPISEGQLLIPGAIVAEVTNYKKPEPLTGTFPQWFLGMVLWRNQHVPVVSIEEFLTVGATSPIQKSTRLIILYGLEASQYMPFYAFIAADIPRTLAVKDAILSNGQKSEKDGLEFDVEITEHGRALLPDLSNLENTLRKLQLASGS